MPVVDVVERVVRVVDEVPARDVVDEAVVVVVDAVGEGDDEVLRREHPGRPVAALFGRRRVRALRVVFDDVRDARVAGVVERVEDALFEHVVRDRPGAAGFAARHAPVGVVVAATRRARGFAVDVRRGIERFRHVDFRRGQLAGVDPVLAPQLQHVAAVVPEDPRVELRDADVGTAERDVHRRVDGRARGDARTGARGHRRVRVRDRHPRHAAELVFLPVEFFDFGFFDRFGGRRLGSRGEVLEHAPAEIRRRFTRRELPRRRFAQGARAYEWKDGERL